VNLDYPRHARQDDWTRFIPSWKLVLGSALTLGFAAVGSAVILFAVTWSRLEIPQESEIATAQTSIVYWNDAETEMARLGDTNRISVPLTEVPLDVQNAVLAAEDRSFHEHSGFAVKGFLRAVWANLTTGQSQGGSTITQQYTKNAFLSSEKTYSRKLDELVLSLKLENQLTKDQILERYLNTIYFGRGAYGIETAAETYFATQAKDLTLEQAATLAAIINAPGRYSPDTHRERLEARYRYVLDGMVEQGWLTQQRRDDALGSFPKVLERRTSQTFAGPTGHLLAAVKQEVLAKGFTEEQVDAGGLRIVSTFDKRAQKAAVAAVKAAGPTTGAKRLRIGLASVVPGSGEVVAMYGGADYLTDSLNNATQAIAQAGSTFKPFALAAAAEAGIALDSQWPGNSPHTVDNYTFQNYANTSYGPSVSLLQGTESSINSVYVEVENRVGVTAVREMALRAGIPETATGWDTTDDLTFVLGTTSPHTLDVANAYATFAARGVHATPTMLRSIGTADGRTLYTPTDPPERTIDENTADLVNHALQSVVRNGTGRPAQALGRPVAGKTGSTDDYLSAWFAGYTPQLATAVTFSKDNKAGTPVSLSGTGGMPQFYGSGYPARVWTAYMIGALDGTPVLPFATPTSFPTGAGLLPPPQPAPIQPDPPAAAPPAPTEPNPATTPAPPGPPPPADPAPKKTKPGKPGKPGGSL
jgi:membrane peptidoglycan carboxypeptidase